LTFFKHNILWEWDNVFSLDCPSHKNRQQPGTKIRFIKPFAYFQDLQEISNGQLTSVLQ